ncbi:MAG: hypothetical protein PHC35_06630 [Deltaproteobacteria bacterium]|nr:hypothetical protein [Deltaproteobacteria bacterium]
MRFTVSKMDPHTTQKKGRTCSECHIDPRALGLGTGNLSFKNGQWHFTPAMQLPNSTPKQATDSFVNIQGDSLVHTSRPGLRPFNAQELNRILYVGLCLSCHKDFNDSVMANWRPNEPMPACRQGKIKAGDNP